MLQEFLSFQALIALDASAVQGDEARRREYMRLFKA